MKNRFLTTLLTLCIAAVGILKAENDKPFVIPELRQWQGADGMVAISPSTKVIYVNAELADAAEAMAEDYGRLPKTPLKKVCSMLMHTARSRREHSAACGSSVSTLLHALTV